MIVLRQNQAHPGDLAARTEFREDRSFILGLTRKATKAWFSDNPAAQFPMESLRKYARMLGDGEGSAQIAAIIEDDALLLRQAASQEHWRLSDRQYGALS